MDQLTQRVKLFFYFVFLLGRSVVRPICPAVVCKPLDCPVFQHFTPQGSCCPECRPQCLHLPVCARIYCPYGYYYRGPCSCRTCKPDKCRGVPCPKIGCLYGSYTLRGQCCPQCRPPQCHGVICPKLLCLHGSYTLPGKCCPECRGSSWFDK